MPIDKTPPSIEWSIRLDVSTIANGYVLTAEGKPTASDPMGSRVESYGRFAAGPWYVREITDAPEMVQHMIDQISMRRTAEENA
jgi:hypothetical protein